jgi:hemerythrin-like domain-containing protein
MACLAQEHRHMSALATLLEQRAQSPKTLTHGDYCLLRDVVGYLHDFPDGVHHPTEDALLERLAHRRPDLADGLAKIRIDHTRLSDETAGLLALLENGAGNATVDHEQEVRSRVVAFADHQRRHMAREQRSLFQVALTDLRPTDWKALSRRSDLHKDPLFGERVRKRHRRLFEFLLDPGDSVPRSAASAIEAQERLVVALDALERGAAAGFATLGRAAAELGEEARGFLAAAQPPATLYGLLAWPWRCGLSAGRAAWGCSETLAALCTAAAQETWRALQPRKRE